MKFTQVLYAGLGGHGSVVNSLIDADRTHAFEHRLIYYGIEALNAAYRDFCEDRAVPYISILKKPGENRKSWKAYLEALEAQKPDVILLHSTNLLLPSWWYALRNGSKLLVVEHQSNQAKRKSEWLWTGLSMFLAKRVIYLTENYRDEVAKRLGWLFRRKKTAVISNGIHTAVFRPAEKTAENLRIGMCSRINPLRDHATLLKAFEIVARQHKQVELHIAGDGTGFESLRELRLNSPLADRIFLHGNLLESELIPFLQQLSVYVHSTLAETMSTAILQAMSTGLPMVVSRISGTVDMFTEGKEGFFFQPGDADELAFKISDMLSNEALMHKFGNAARERAVQMYSVDSMFAAYENLVRTSVQG